MEVKKSIPLGYLIILVSAVLFGSYGVWSRLMGDTFQPFFQGWVRSLVILAIMTPPMLLTKSFKKIPKSDWPALAFFIGFCIFTQVPLYYAYNHAPIGAVQLIFYSMYIIASYVVGKIYLKESITKVKLIAMALAFTGLLIVFGRSAFVFAPFGLALAAFNGVASGAETSSTKRISDKYPPALIIFWGWVFTFLTHLPLSLLVGETQPTVHINQAWGWLMVYSVVNALAFWLAVVGYRHVDASIGSLIGLSEVIFAIIFGAILFHESITWSIYVGGVIILGAAMLPDLVNIVQHKRVPKGPQPIREF